MTDPTPKHPDFRYLSREPDEPTNGEPPLSLLVAQRRTPAPLFFIRNHAPAPGLSEHGHRFCVEGLVERSLELSVRDLRQRFGAREVEATLQCAGNRREGLMKVRPIPEETPWGAGAISNAAWTGVPLGDVLRASGLRDGARHVELVGHDRVEHDGERLPFGGSIALDEALDDVLLAWAMNGEPLPRDHGFPLRAVVPGYIGARSVKWLSRIVVRSEPSENHHQRHSYKLFPPQVGPGDVDWDAGQMLGELSLTSVICSPAPGAELHRSGIEIAGYAMAGGDRTIARVEISVDGGTSWLAADVDRGSAGVWSLWRCRLELPPGDHVLICRAWDSAANTQPEHPGPLWNFKGYMNNAWHRVRVSIREK